MIAAIGSDRFVLGFRLAGIRDTTVADEENVVQRVREQKAAIVILDESLLESASDQDLLFLETSMQPIVVFLSEDVAAQQERLRREMRSTLGVDLL